jgi:hypothetical protein
MEAQAPRPTPQPVKAAKAVKAEVLKIKKDEVVDADTFGSMGPVDGDGYYDGDAPPWEL